MSLKDKIPLVGGSSSSSLSEEEVRERERLSKDKYDTSPTAGSTSEYQLDSESIKFLGSYEFDKWGDDGNRSLREQLSDNKRLIWPFLFISIPFWVYIGRIAFDFLPSPTNPIVWGPIISISIIVGIYLVGRRSMLRWFTQRTIIVSMTPNGGFLLSGKSIGTSDELLYKVHRGHSFLGYISSVLELGDISNKLAKMQQKSDRDDDAVIFQLKTAHTRRVFNTFLGDIVVTRGNQIEVDPTSSTRDFTLSRPDTVDEQEYNRLKEQHRNAQTTIQSLAEENRTLQSQLHEAQQARRKREERIKQEKGDEYREILKVSGGQQVQPMQVSPEYGTLEQSENNNDE